MNDRLLSGRGRRTNKGHIHCVWYAACSAADDHFSLWSHRALQLQIAVSRGNLVRFMDRGLRSVHVSCAGQARLVNWQILSVWLVICIRLYTVLQYLFTASICLLQLCLLLCYCLLTQTAFFIIFKLDSRLRSKGTLCWAFDRPTLVTY